MKLQKIVFGLLLICIWPITIVAQQDTLRLLHLSDLHLIFNNEQFHPALAANRKVYENGVAPFRHFMQTVPAETGADFVIVNGDLIDFYDGVLPSGEMFAYQIEQFVDLIEEFTSPVLYVLGNHDIVSYGWSGSGRTSSQHVAGIARAAFIRNAPAMRNGTFYHKLFKVGDVNYRILFIDNAFNALSAADGVVLPYIDKPQLKWLEYQLKSNPDDIVIAVMHIPMDVESENKEDVAEVYNLLREYPSVKMVLAGHQHINRIHDFHVSDGFIQVQTAAFALDRKSWRSIMLTENSIVISLPGQTETEIVRPIR